MDLIPEQVAFFMGLMKTRMERRLWIAQCRHRAQLLEAEYPEDYAGLSQALEAALAAQKSLGSTKSEGYGTASMPSGGGSPASDGRSTTRTRTGR